MQHYIKASDLIRFVENLGYAKEHWKEHKRKKKALVAKIKQNGLTAFIRMSYCPMLGARRPIEPGTCPYDVSPDDIELLDAAITAKLEFIPVVVHVLPFPTIKI